MALTEKFKTKDISILRSAANGDIYLDVKNRNFTRKSVDTMNLKSHLLREPLDDYEMLMENLFKTFKQLRLLDESYKKPTVLMERFPYRYVEVGTLENGSPDCRIQKIVPLLKGIVICTFAIIKCN